MMVVSILATLVLISALFYHRISLAASSAILLLWTAAWAAAHIWTPWLLLPLAILLLPLNLPSIRRSLFSKPMLQRFQKVMPPMSRTEKEAIDAGTTWWEGDLFQGKPDWQKLHNYPQPRLTPAEQAFLDGPVEEACRMANDFAITHEMADLPPELWAYLKEQRFFAMIIKKEYGGLEFSAYAQARVLQKLAGVSGILAITVGVPNSLGPGELLQHYGTDEQKDHYLPRLARGDEIPCFALTSPEAGSDAGAIPDTGVVCMGEWQGKQVLGMRLTWNKRYITLAPVATVLGLAFKLFDPDRLLGDTESLGITCALIPTSTPGVEIGKRHFPLNVPFQNGPTRGNDIFVPIDFIIGGPQMAGQGWRMLVECLSVGRGITPAFELYRQPEKRGARHRRLCAYPSSVQGLYRQDGRHRRAAGAYCRQRLRDGRCGNADHHRYYAGRKTGGAVGDCEVSLHPSRPARHYGRHGYCGRQRHYARQQ